jgi:hypothetical protein
MNRNSNTGGRVVPQANNSSGGGRGFSRIIQAAIGAYSQVRDDEARTKREYESEVIKSAGHATRKEVDREHFNNVMQDVDVKNRAIKESGGLRFTGMSSTGFELEKTGNQPGPGGGTKGTGRGGKKSGNATTANGSKRSKGGSIAATVGAIKSKKVDFEQATGGEFGDEAGISPKLTADFGAHAAAGGDQESYLNQFGPSGRRRRTKPPKPNTPPPPSGGGAGTPKKKAAKKISTGGGLTEVRNPDIETGSRSKK